jgi:hypothetical protein
MAGGSNTVAVTVVVTPAAAPPQSGHTPATHHPTQLAFTGAPIDALTAVASAAVLAGTVLLTAFRRRAQRQTSWGTT